MNVLIAADVPHVPMERVPVTIRVLGAQLDPDAQDTATGAPILLLRRLQTNNIAVM